MDQQSIIPNQPAPETGAIVDEQSIAPAETPKKKSKVGLIIAIIAAVLVIGGGIAGFFIFQNVQENARREAFITDAKNYIKLVANTEDNVQFYPFATYGTSAQLDKSPYDNKYQDKSYVTNYYGHTYVCLTDGEKRVSGFASQELAIDDSDDCNYQFLDHSNLSDGYDYNEKKAYIEYYAKKEYKFLKPSIEIKDGKIQVTSQYYNFDIDATVANNTISVNAEDQQRAEEEYLKTASPVAVVEYFLRREYKTNDLRNDSPVTVPEVKKQDGITLVSSYSEDTFENTKKMMTRYKELVEKYKINMPGIAFYMQELNRQKGTSDWYIAVGQRLSDGKYIMIENKDGTENID